MIALKNKTLFAVFLAGLCAFWLPSTYADSGKKIIEFGWDEPSTSFIRRNVRKMERMPFDGLVYRVVYEDDARKSFRFSNHCFGRKRIKWKWLLPAAEDLRLTAFQKFTDNFLRFNLMPADIDWFDDFSAATHNAVMAGRFVRHSGSKGIFFDLEQYRGRMFHYPGRPRSQQISFKDYAAQARLRGEQIVRAFEKGAKGEFTLFLSFGHEKAAGQELDTWKYGLLPAFLDGIYSAAAASTHIVDGYEDSYLYNHDRQFAAAYRQIHFENTLLSQTPAYPFKVRAAFGLWMDRNWKHSGWNVKDPDQNPAPPAQFSEAVRAALARTDRYVWIYTEQPNWWEGTKLPESYIKALRDARFAAGLDRKQPRPGRGISR